MHLQKRPGMRMAPPPGNKVGERLNETAQRQAVSLNPNQPEELSGWVAYKLENVIRAVDVKRM